MTKDSGEGMTVNYMDLGMRVRRQREKKRMTQTQLASAAELSTQHVSNIEHGKSKVSLEKIVSIANALECTVDELLCGSMNEAQVIYIQEANDMIGKFSDAQLRALPEFLRSYSYFGSLLEKNIQQKDVKEED